MLAPGGSRQCDGPPPVGSGILGEQGFDEPVGVERFQVFDTLADSDVLDWQVHLLPDRYDDSASGSTIELGQYDAGAVDDLGEVSRLAV